MIARPVSTSVINDLLEIAQGRDVEIKRLRMMLEISLESLIQADELVQEKDTEIEALRQFAYASTDELIGEVLRLRAELATHTAWEQRAYIAIECVLAVLPLLELQDWHGECKARGIKSTDILTTAPAAVRGGKDAT